MPPVTRQPETEKSPLQSTEIRFAALACKVIAASIFVAFLATSVRAETGSNSHQQPAHTPLSIGQSTATAAPLQVRFSQSRLHALVLFAESLVFEHWGNPVYAELYAASQFADNPEIAALVAKLRQAKLESVGYQLPLHPDNFGYSKELWDQVELASIRTADLIEFKRQTAGIFSQEVHGDFSDLLKQLDPIFEQLVWQPQRQSFHGKFEQLTSLAKKHDFADSVTRISVFYGARWDQDIPLEIGFYPNPPSYGFIAKPNANTISSGLPTDIKNVALPLATAAHESGHLFFAEQPLALKRRINALFLNHSSPNAIHALHWFDEALATAVGNGWMRAQLTGERSSGSWYNNDYVDTYAKAIYPKVSSYLSGGRTIDKNFVDYAIRRFDESFPLAYREIDNLLSFGRIHVDPNTQPLLADSLMKEFRFRAFEINQLDLLVIDSLAGFYPDTQDNGHWANIYVLQQNDSRSFAALANKFPPLQDVSEGWRNSGMFSFYTQRRFHLVIRYRTFKDLQQLSARLKGQRSVTLNRVIRLD